MDKIWKCQYLFKKIPRKTEEKANWINSFRDDSVFSGIKDWKIQMNRIDNSKTPNMMGNEVGRKPWNFKERARDKSRYIGINGQTIERKKGVPS